MGEGGNYLFILKLFARKIVCRLACRFCKKSVLTQAVRSLLCCTLVEVFVFVSLSLSLAYCTTNETRERRNGIERSSEAAAAKIGQEGYGRRTNIIKCDARNTNSYSQQPNVVGRPMLCR